MKTVSVIIVNWNGYKDTIGCLSSLERLEARGITVKKIIVDNGSTDGSVAKIAKVLPHDTILTLPTNLGFTGGNNVGMKYAMLNGADYIWLLNNDTFVDRHALNLLDAFNNPDVGIAGSKIYFAPGHEYHKDRYTAKDRGKVFWYAGGLVDWDNMYASHRGVDEVDIGQYDETLDTPFVTGCSMMISKAVIEKVGYLDEKYYLYLEDLDFGLRAKRAGFRLLYYPKSVVWHVNAGSSGGAGNPLHDYYITRNRLLLGFRYASGRTKFALLREAITFLAGSNAEKKRAVMDFITHKFGKQYEPQRYTS
ncbi:MAG TPA: glycosyltransferase family 2 protein [Patescibacteria group bacterium]|nr:glycosyltransferase family 2 protein [Patescibacteria group bacterium]